MGRRLPSIPRPSSGQIPKAIVDILNPMREILEARVLSRNNNTTANVNELAITRGDLLELGLATQEQLNNLGNSNGL